MFDDYLEQLSTRDTAVNLVADVHKGDPSQLVRVRGVAFLRYRNYLASVSFVKVSLSTPELVLE